MSNSDNTNGPLEGSIVFATYWLEILIWGPGNSLISVFSLTWMEFFLPQRSNVSWQIREDNDFLACYLVKFDMRPRREGWGKLTFPNLFEHNFIFIFLWFCYFSLWFFTAHIFRPGPNYSRKSPTVTEKSCNSSLYVVTVKGGLILL